MMLNKDKIRRGFLIDYRMLNLPPYIVTEGSNIYSILHAVGISLHFKMRMIRREMISYCKFWSSFSSWSNG